MKKIKYTIKSWYQFGILIDTHHKTFSQALQIINDLKKSKIITDWFFLWEGENLKIRIKSSHELKDLKTHLKNITKTYKAKLSPQTPFTEYYEENELFASSQVFKAYITMLSASSKLIADKFNKKEHFSSYDLTSLFSHSLYNNTFGMPTENYFMIKRLMKTNIQVKDFIDDPEQTAYDKTGKIIKTKEIKVNIPELLIPVQNK